MSIALLRNRNKKHAVQDDFESFIYVMLYHGLRYLAHNQPRSGLRSIMTSIFDGGINVGNGQWHGGTVKTALARDLDPLRPDFQFNCTPFDLWITEMLSAIDQWIGVLKARKRTQPDDSAVNSNVDPTTDAKKVMFHDHSRLDSFWKKVLGMDGWPTNDQATYQLEPQGTKRSHEDDDQPAQKKHKSGRSGAAAASGNAPA